MVDDRVLNYIISTKHPLYEWGANELIERANEFIAQQKQYDHIKYVVSYTIYNEGDFLEQSLDNCLLINDLDGIYLLDGAWLDGGGTAKSSDETADIIEQWSRDHPYIKVVFEQSDKMWKNQGTKRNHALKRVESIWGESYIIVKDGDEMFKFNSGHESIWLKQKTIGLFPAILIMKSYARGGGNSMIGARMIPTSLYHYHTDKSMIIHDVNCGIVCNYNIGNNFVRESKCVNYDTIFYINYWTVRNKERAQTKDDYAAKYVYGERKLIDCDWKH